MLQVNLGYSQLKFFCSMFHEHDAATRPFPLMTCQTYLPTDKLTDICLATDSIQSAQGDPHYRFTPRESLDKIHAVGDKLRLSRSGINQAVDVLAVEVDEATQVPYFSVALNDGHSI